MYKLQLILVILLALIFQASKNSDYRAGKKKPPVFAGKVFELSSGVNTNNCSCNPHHSDKNHPTYVFLNDSIFFKILESHSHVTTLAHYTGTYKATYDKLILKYDSSQIVYYSQMEFDPRENNYKHVVEIKKEHIFSNYYALITYDETLPITYCQNGFYFREIWEPWSEYYMARSDSQPEDYVKQMKDLGVWDRLFN